MFNVRRLVMQIGGMAVVFASTLFLAAGTVAWVPGWIFLALFFGFVNLLTIWLIRRNPDLLKERMTGFTADQKAWDKAILVASGGLFFTWLIAMPLDAVRFRWSKMATWLQVVGAGILIGSFSLFFLTFRENAYLSPVVRIQKDRGQTVVSTGPYRYVRHPMYAAFALFVVGTALLLGSWSGLLGGAILGGLVSRRAVLEERALRDELPGYASYMTRVRSRLIPRVW